MSGSDTSSEAAKVTYEFLREVSRLHRVSYSIESDPFWDSNKVIVAFVGEPDGLRALGNRLFKKGWEMIGTTMAYVSDGNYKLMIQKRKAVLL